MILQLGKIHSFGWGKLPIRASLPCRVGLERVRVLQMLRKRGEAVCHKNMVRETGKDEGIWAVRSNKITRRQSEKC